MWLVPELPNADRQDAAVRRFIGTTGFALAMAAIASAFLWGHLPDRVPAWALHHPAVWRLEVALALFALGFAMVNVIALAFHGWLFTGIGAGAAQGNAEKVAAEEEQNALAGTVSAVEKISEAADEVLADLHERLTAVERANDIEPPSAEPPKLSDLIDDTERDAQDHIPGTTE